jgi:hypothetical protein
MATNIKNLRILGGEDILGEVVAETNEYVTLKNPVRVMLVPSKTDPKNPSVGFAPYCEWTADKEVSINKAHIVCQLNPVPEFVNQYNTVFGGIQVPQSKIIVPGK